jgi:hypothetical protein
MNNIDPKDLIPIRPITLKAKKDGKWVDTHYAEVRERQRIFRQHPDYKGFRLITDWVEKNDSVADCVAKIFNANNELVATGSSRKVSSNANYIEKTETAAWGRALANLGIGLEYGVASAEEMKAVAEEEAIKAKSAEENASLRDIIKDGIKFCEVELQVTPDQVFAYLGIINIKEAQSKHLTMLRSAVTAIRQGESSLKYFPSKNQKNVEGIKKGIKDGLESPKSNRKKPRTKETGAPNVSGDLGGKTS